MSQSDSESPDRIATMLLSGHFEERAEDRLALFTAGWDGGSAEQAYRHCYRKDLFRLLYAAATDALRSIVVSSCVDAAGPEEAYSLANQTNRLTELAELVESRSAGKKRVLNAALHKAFATADNVSDTLAAAGPVDLAAEFESHSFGEQAGGDAATAKTIGADDYLNKLYQAVTSIRNKAVTIGNKHPFPGLPGPPDDPAVVRLRSRMERFDAATRSAK